MNNISVVTVVYNQKKYITDCLDGIRAQTQPPYEYIVIDGGSTDGTLQILEAATDVISVLVSGRDEGIYDAMNKGIANASGNYILMVNSDDWLEPTAVEALMHHVSENTGISAVYGSMNVWSKSGVLLGTYRSREEMSDLLAAPFNHPALLVAKKAYEDIGTYDEQFHTAADYDFMLRLKRAGLRYGFVDHVISNFRRVGITSQSSRPPTKQLFYIFRKNKLNWLLIAYALAYRELRWVTQLVAASLPKGIFSTNILSRFSRIDPP